MKFDNIEFFSSPEGDILIKHSSNPVRELSEHDIEIINHLFERIRVEYSDAYSCLVKTYETSMRNVPYFRYLCVRRFIRCNFANYDTLSEDIDSDSVFHFEFVQCPLHGECAGYNRICNPKFNTTLTITELRVLELYCKPMEMDHIASILFVSPATIEVHVKNIRKKLNLHSKAELIKFWDSRMK